MLVIRLITRLLRSVPFLSVLRPRHLVRTLLRRYARHFLRTELIRLAIDSILGARIL